MEETKEPMDKSEAPATPVAEAGGCLCVPRRKKRDRQAGAQKPSRLRRGGGVTGEPLRSLTVRMERGLPRRLVTLRGAMMGMAYKEKQYVVYGGDIIGWLLGDVRSNVESAEEATLVGQQMLDSNYIRRLSRKRATTRRATVYPMGKTTFRGGNAVYQFNAENCSDYLLHVIPFGCTGPVHHKGSRYLVLRAGNQHRNSDIVEKSELLQGHYPRLQRFVLGIRDPRADQLRVEGYLYRLVGVDTYFGTAHVSLSNLQILSHEEIQTWQQRVTAFHQALLSSGGSQDDFEELDTGLRESGGAHDEERDPIGLILGDRERTLSKPSLHDFIMPEGGPGPMGDSKVRLLMKLEKVASDASRARLDADSSVGRLLIDQNLRLHAHVFEVRGVTEKSTSAFAMRWGQALGIRYNVKVRVLAKNSEIDTDYTSKSPNGDAAWPILQTGTPEGELLEMELKHCNRNVDIISVVVLQKLPSDTEISAIGMGTVQVAVRDIALVEDEQQTKACIKPLERPATRNGGRQTRKNAPVRRLPSFRSMGELPVEVDAIWLPLTITSVHGGRTLRTQNGEVRVALWLSAADLRLLTETQEAEGATGMADGQRQSLPARLPISCLESEILVGLSRLRASMLGPGVDAAGADAAPPVLPEGQCCTDLMAAFYSELGLKEPKASAWQKDASGILQRQVTYVMPRSALVPENHVSELHQLLLDEPNAFVLRVTIDTPEVPYGSKFSSIVQLVFIRPNTNPLSKVEVMVSAEIAYKNGGPPSWLKGQISGGAARETQRTWGAFVGLVNGAAQGKRKRKAASRYTKKFLVTRIMIGILVLGICAYLLDIATPGPGSFLSRFSRKAADFEQRVHADLAQLDDALEGGQSNRAWGL